MFIRDVADGDLVGWIDHRLDQAHDSGKPDSLETEIMDQAVEQCGGVVAFDCGTQSSITKLVEQVEGASQTADLMDQANGMINRSGIQIDSFRS